jgi:small subunit ribosomal protein S1
MAERDDDFATLFEASLKARRFEKGQTIEGRVVSIGADVAFVDVGGKGEATIDLGELKDDDGALEVTVGDRIQAVVVSTSGGLTLSRKLARGAATLRQLEDAFRSGLPVDGKVEREVKGGYEVRIARQRAFCPVSQIDIARNTEPSAHIGRVYTFRVVEFKEGGRNLVVSRRALLEEEQQARAAELRRSIEPGAVMTGRVASVRDFGAFVELGAGVQGLLHVSEMGWSRSARPSEFVTVGDEITVKVVRVEDDGQKIALSLKQLADDPWSKVQATYEVGQVRDGRVTRLAEFGAFVELEPGVEALAHVSTFPPSGGSAWRKLVPVGTTAAFEILSLDLDAKRIGVALVQEGGRRRADTPASDEAREHIEAAPSERLGSLADKLRGALKPRE